MHRFNDTITSTQMVFGSSDFKLNSRIVLLMGSIGHTFTSVAAVDDRPEIGDIHDRFRYRDGFDGVF